MFGAIALVFPLILNGCGETNRVTASSAPSASSASQGSMAHEQVPTPDCGRTDIASEEYGTKIDPTSGTPGTEVSFFGTTLRGEDWKWAAADRLEAWWNTDVPSSEVPDALPVSEGPILMIARIDDMERCRFKTTFTVPDVDAGRYKISVFVWNARPSDGYGYFLPHFFRVTD